MKLYYFPGSCALAPHIVLNWVGADYEAVRVVKGDPEYRKINPLGVVPAIHKDGKLYTQADAILHWLAASNPDARLAGDGTAESDYEINTWMAFLTGDLHPAFFPFFNPQRYTTDENGHDAVKAAGQALVAKFYDHMEAHLQGRDFFVGDRRSIVDAYTVPMLRWGRLLDKPLREYPALNGYLRQLERDAGVRDAMIEQGLIKS
ncbi:MAG: glutathione binding-like protein [Pseudomonadota bacterium]